MNSRERVIAALQHREGDRVPLDLGGCGQTGMHVSTVYALRQALRLDPPGVPVKVIEPYQMLGEIKPDLWAVLGVDVAGFGGLGNLFGFRNEDWKPCSGMARRCSCRGSSIPSWTKTATS
jgi:hypothetical protein